MKPKKMSGDIVEQIAKETGTTFNRIRDLSGYHIQLGIPFNFKQIVEEMGITFDPNVAYLVDPLDANAMTHFPMLPCGKHVDAILHWEGGRLENHAISWSATSKAAIRKIFSDDGSDDECIVCTEDLPLHEAVKCSVCCCALCASCALKLSLTETMLRRIMSGQFQINYNCPQCRDQLACDLRVLTYRVLDQLEDFSKDQTRAILFAKENDQHFTVKWMKWIEHHPLRNYKPEVMIELKGLKTKKHWNGKKAKIIGQVVTKNGTVRWPVQLVRGSKQKVMIKQANMVSWNRQRRIPL